MKWQFDGIVLLCLTFNCLQYKSLFCAQNLIKKLFYNQIMQIVEESLLK